MVHPFLWISKWLWRVQASTCIRVPRTPLGLAALAISRPAGRIPMSMVLRCIRAVKSSRMGLLRPKFWKFILNGLMMVSEPVFIPHRRLYLANISNQKLASLRWVMGAVEQEIPSCN